MNDGVALPSGAVVKYQVMRSRLCTSQGPPFRFWQVFASRVF